MNGLRDEAGGVVLERVRPRVHLGPARGTDGATAPGTPTEEPPVAASAASDEIARRPLAPGDLVPVAATAVVGLLSGDFVASAMAGVTAGLAVAFRRIARTRQFGFADGFVGYRADTGWPRGVQEDDDFHWTWTPDEQPPPAPIPRSATD